MAKRYAFFDIESHNAGKHYGVSPREFFRLGQVAINDGPVVLFEDYREFMGVLESADYLVGHNISNFDLSVLYGTDSLRPLELALERRVIDTFCLAALLNPAPYQYTNKNGQRVFDAAKPERALKWLSLDEQANQLGLPGKLGNLKELAKKYQPEGTKVADYDYGLIPTSDPEFREYAEGDVIAVRALFYKLMEMQRQQQYSSDYLWREQLVYAICAQITRNGVTVDKAEAQKRVEELAAEREEVMQWLIEEYAFPETGKSPWATTAGKEVIFKVLEDFGITEKTRPDWERTATGNLSLGGQAILDLVEGVSEEAERFGRAVATLKGQRSLAQLALDSCYEDGKAHPDITAIQRSGRTSVTRPGLTIWTARGPGAVEKRYFVADPGDVMVEADFSAADARAVAAMSGDHEFAKRFEPGVDAHDISGVIFFGEEEYFANRDAMRPIAKACIAEGQLVLTDRGEVPIEAVQKDDLVWDGQRFVTHCGTILVGEKEVITYDGLTATPDHIVYTEENHGVEVPFGYAATSGARLVRSATAGKPVRVGDSHFVGEAIPNIEQGGVLHRSGMHGLRSFRVGELPEPCVEENPRMPGMCRSISETVSEMAGEKDGLSQAEVPEPKQSGVPGVRRPGGHFPLGEQWGCGGLDLENPRAIRQGSDHRPDRYERGLRAGEHQTCDARGATGQSQDHGSLGVRPEVLAVRPERSGTVLESGVQPRGDNRGRGGERPQQGVPLSPGRKKARVYDIRDAGPYNRFTVSGRLVHNCGHALAYRVGAKKLAATAGYPDHKGYEMLKAYQEAYRFVAMWQNEVTDFGEKNGYVENAWGRRMMVDEGRSFTQSSALLGQSTTREMLFDGLIRIVQDDIEKVRWVRMLIHDAVVFSIPEQEVESGVPWLMERMQSYFDPKNRVGFPVYFPMEHGPLDKRDWFTAGH